MKFEQLPYKRPDVELLCAEIEKLAGGLGSVKPGEIVAVFKRHCEITDEAKTQSSIAMIRHTINTKDEFYAAENDFFDHNSPLVSDKSLGFYRAVLGSPHKQELAEKYGDILLDKMQIAVKTSDSRIVALQQEENKLETKYDTLYASAKIDFMGKELTLPQLSAYKQNINRQVRKEAFEAEGAFFDYNREVLDQIYSDMVTNRTKQAKTLGLSDFVALGDLRMERLGYSRGDIKKCRDAIVRDVVPICMKLKKAQQQRLGIEEMKLYDELIVFKEGNPVPKGTPEALLAAGQKMYSELSVETEEFIDFMMQGDLFDVISRQGKAPGGYCTSIPGYSSPFIFSNFNGTSADVDVLTHEAGHAFADYIASRQGLVPELRSPGLESCEIHSMSMEFLTADYYPLFFGQDSKRYAFQHAMDALLFLPYGCQVDEFQEIMYTNPALTPAQRCDIWLELERKYRPWIDHAGIPFYGRGAAWQRQLHIYEVPFYYIDYVLAQCVALEFYRLSDQNKQGAWQKYLALVKKAGTNSYSGLVQAAGLKTPFEDGMIKKAAEYVYLAFNKEL